jgi:hypothetical protein
VRAVVWADYVISHKNIWFTEYLTHKDGNLEEILAKHSWTYNDFVNEVNKEL